MPHRQLSPSSPEQQTRTIIYIVLTILVLGGLSIFVELAKAGPYHNWGKPRNVTTTATTAPIQLVVFSHQKCQPCQVIPSYLAQLKPLGWNDSHITVIKHFGEYQLPVYPLYIRFENGYATGAFTGLMTASQMTTFYYENRVATQ